MFYLLTWTNEWLLYIQGDLGFLYLDLYSRKGKYPSCAHFAIRGGCQVSKTEYQLPVWCWTCWLLAILMVVLVFGFTVITCYITWGTKVISMSSEHVGHYLKCVPTSMKPSDLFLKNLRSVKYCIYTKIWFSKMFNIYIFGRYFV